MGINPVNRGRTGSHREELLEMLWGKKALWGVRGSKMHSLSVMVEVQTSMYEKAVRKTVTLYASWKNKNKKERLKEEAKKNREVGHIT